MTPSLQPAPPSPPAPSLEPAVQPTTPVVAVDLMGEG